MTPDAPIGMFDSGFGGLTVARAVIDLLPHENLVYIGDTGRYPYGNKPADEVRRYARELAHSLVEDYGAKMIVVACNTAASVALTDLQAELDVPVVGVVEPGARALVRVTHNNKVGVIGTVGTISSGAYVEAVRATGANVTLTWPHALGSSSLLSVIKRRVMKSRCSPSDCSHRCARRASTHCCSAARITPISPA